MLVTPTDSTPGSADTLGSRPALRAPPAARSSNRSLRTPRPQRGQVVRPAGQRRRAAADTGSCRAARRPRAAPSRSPAPAPRASNPRRRHVFPEEPRLPSPKPSRLSDNDRCNIGVEREERGGEQRDAAGVNATTRTVQAEAVADTACRAIRFAGMSAVRSLHRPRGETPGRARRRARPAPVPPSRTGGSTRPRDAPSARAHGDLARAALGANQNQAGDVHAGDEQQQPRAAEQHQQDRDGSSPTITSVSGIDGRALTAIGIGILRVRAVGRSPSRSASAARDGHAILQPADSVRSRGSFASDRTPPAACSVRPELGDAHRSEVKVARQHADDGVRAPVQGHRLAEHIGSRRRSGSATRRSSGSRCRGAAGRSSPDEEIAAEDRSDAERAKEPVADARARCPLGACRRCSADTPPSGVDVQRA